MATPGLPGTEICGDGIDNDCDGQVDEADCVEPTRAATGCSSGGPNGPASSMLLLLGMLAGLAVRRRARA